MIDKEAIEEVVWQGEGWKYQRLVISLKSQGGKLWINVGKWLPLNGSTENMRPKCSMFMTLEDWKGVLPMIQKMIDDNSSK